MLCSIAAGCGAAGAPPTPTVTGVSPAGERWRVAVSGDGACVSVRVRSASGAVEDDRTCPGAPSGRRVRGGYLRLCDTGTVFAAGVRPAGDVLRLTDAAGTTTGRAVDLGARRFAFVASGTGGVVTLRARRPPSAERVVASVPATRRACRATPGGVPSSAFLDFGSRAG